jgi:polyvinyl alcohol dehydrogenase (cytochrome)
MRVNGVVSRTKKGRAKGSTARTRGWVFGVVLGTIAVTPLMAQNSLFPFSSDWPMFGQNASNTANASAETAISTKTVSELKTKWTFTTGGDVSARAAVVNGVAYFPDWAGNLFAVNASTGKLVWSHQFSDYGLAAGTVSRTSPAVVDGIVYVGTQYVAPASATAPQPPTGWLLAIDAGSGKLIWKVQPDTSNPFPVITGSPVVAFGIVYVGMTSDEEFAAAEVPGYKCCSVRSSVVAVDAFFGLKLWQTFTVPTGYTGGAVWGSNPVVDLLRGSVFIGTGNNYSVPTDPAYVECVAKGGTEASCLSPNDHADSIIALNMFTGQVKWATRLMTWSQTGVVSGSDSWNVSCSFGSSPGVGNCPAESGLTPPTAGPDFDFGSSPNEITYQTGGSGPLGLFPNTKTIIGAGQKSGIYYALDPDTGAELWHTQVGPGSSLGGIEWGSATDGTNIYVAISNLYGIPYAGGSAGSFAALNPATGAIVWQKADPNGAIDLGPMAAANGVVFGASMAGSASAPTMFALNAANGNTLWSFAAGSSVNAGATIVDGVVYWGSGYTHIPIPGFTGNTKFYAFSINGK